MSTPQDSELPAPLRDAEEALSLLLGRPNSDLAEYRAKLELIQRRCADASIACELRDSVDHSQGLVVNVPNGRSWRSVVIATSRDADRLLASSFERFVFLADYLAIVDYDGGRIECAVRHHSAGALPASAVFRQLFGFAVYESLREKGAPEELVLMAPHEHPGVRLVLSRMSRNLLALSNRATPRAGVAALLIEGVSVKTHDAAVELLERLAHAVFLGIDLRFELPLTLMKERRRPQRGRRVTADTEPLGHDFPKFEYAAQPMSLYWYGRSALGMPLLQFLAFYQCLEYFFPMYSQTEAQRRVRNILRDPAFNAARDTDVARLVSSVRSGHGQGFGDERSQLRATLNECVDPGDLRSFLQDVPERTEFLAKKTDVSNKKVIVANPTVDLRNDVAERIYDIRCKIVHTKAGGQEGEVDLLLPFSKEAESLEHDIDLVQYVARRALIASGSPLTLRTTRT